MLRKKLVRCLILFVFDMLIIGTGYLLAYWLRLDVVGASGSHTYRAIIWSTLPWLLIIRFLCGLLVRQYTWSFGHASLSEAFGLANATLVGTLIFVAVTRIAGRADLIEAHVPRAIYFMEFSTSLLGMGFIRFFPRYAYHLIVRRNAHRAVDGKERIRVLIFGAGHTGELVLRDILRLGVHPYHVVGFIDDDPLKQGTSRQGVRVVGRLGDVPNLIRPLRVERILVAVPDFPKARLRELIDMCAEEHITFKIVPPMEEILGKRSGAPIRLKDIHLEDLLERTPVQFDHTRMAEFFVDQTVVVTGAAGSIGSEICRQVARQGIKRLVAVDQNENDLYFLRLDIEEIAPGLDFRIAFASIRDRRRMAEIFQAYHPRIVFHAAAHKHVPLMEDCPLEAVKNNVLGSLHVAECAEESGAERFVLISTDKAVRPTNIMGATKRLTEILINDLDKRSRTRFMTVRFGNVLGSAGSLVPILQRQIERGGPITVTHPNITRYFMTIPEAVGLVVIAAVQHEGTTCVLDMGEPLSVDRLARQMVTLAGLIPEKDIAIHYTGLRSGEKMYEELFTPDERLTSSSHPRIRIAHCAEYVHDLGEMREDLLSLANHGTDADARAFLLRYVPGFQPATESDQAGPGTPAPDPARADRTGSRRIRPRS